MAVKSNNSVIFGVHGKCAHADYIGNLERASKGVEQQSGTNATALRF